MKKSEQLPSPTASQTRWPYYAKAGLIFMVSTIGYLAVRSFGGLSTLMSAIGHEDTNLRVNPLGEGIDKAPKKFELSDNNNSLRRINSGLPDCSVLPNQNVSMVFDTDVLFSDPLATGPLNLTIELKALTPVRRQPETKLELMPLTNSWQFSLTPSNENAANYLAVLTVTNPLGGKAEDSFGFRIEGPPIMNGEIPPQYAKVGEVFGFSIPQNLITDPNLDPLSFSVNATPPWLKFNPIAASFTGKPGETDVGLVPTITLWVRDPAGGRLMVNFSITVDHAPVIYQPLAQKVIPIGQNLSFAIPNGTFIDPDGDTLTIEAHSVGTSSLPPFLSFNPSLGIFSASANSSHAGSYVLEVTASDPKSKVTTRWPVLVEYFPVPQVNISNQLFAIGEPFNLAISPNSFYDADDSTLDYSVSQPDGSELSDGLSFNRASLILSGLPSGFSRILPVLVKGTDRAGASAAMGLNLTFTHFPKVIKPIGSLVFEVGQAVDWNIPNASVIDEDSEPLSYQLSAAANSSWPSGLSFDASNQRLSGLPSQTGFDQYFLDLTAQDPWGANVTQTVRLIFEHAPRVNNPISQLAIAVEQPFSWTLPSNYFIDADSDALTITAVQIYGNSSAEDPLPEWLHFYPAPVPTLSAITTLNELGKQVLVCLTASDPYGSKVISKIAVAVTYPPQVIKPIPTPPPWIENRWSNFTLDPSIFQDLDDPVLWYQVNTSKGEWPTWLNVTANNLTLIGKPPPSAVGVWPLEFTAIDKQGLKASAYTEFTVQPNEAPRVATPIPDQEAPVLEKFRFFLPKDTFFDPNNDSLSYRAAGEDGSRLPSWLDFDAKKLEFSGMPKRGDTGEVSDKKINLAVFASDGEKETSAQFQISVTGNSDLKIFLKLGLPIITILSILLALCRRQAWINNRCKSHPYEKLQLNMVIGQEFKYELKTPKTEVGKVQIKLPQPWLNSSGFFASVSRCLHSHRKALPGGAVYPFGFEYDDDRNEFRSKDLVPKTNYGQLIIQVKNHSGRTVEKRSIRVEKPSDKVLEVEQMFLPPPPSPPKIENFTEVEMETLAAPSRS